uniref:Robl_LC7 domain-containing protein n=1 Tax=Angiostrongylus cantonensis TaxID=6313 RepID=A0A0K0DHF8_ANGCA
MLRQKALVEVLAQVNTGDIFGSLLFNREGAHNEDSGLLIAYSGYRDSKDHANVSAALISSIWESFDRKGGREDLKETLIMCEDGVMAAIRVANMLLALKVAFIGFEKLSFGDGSSQTSFACQVS